jgi:hypothetical protein
MIAWSLVYQPASARPDRLSRCCHAMWLSCLAIGALAHGHDNASIPGPALFAATNRPREK